MISKDGESRKTGVRPRFSSFPANLGLTPVLENLGLTPVLENLGLTPVFAVFAVNQPCRESHPCAPAANRPTGAASVSHPPGH